MWATLGRRYRTLEQVDRLRAREEKASVRRWIESWRYSDKKLREYFRQKRLKPAQNRQSCEGRPNG